VFGVGILLNRNSEITGNTIITGMSVNDVNCKDKIETDQYRYACVIDQAACNVKDINDNGFLNTDLKCSLGKKCCEYQYA